MVLVATGETVRGADAPTAEELVKRYDTIMGADAFEALFSMAAHRDDGSTRTYEMKVLKSGNDKLRLWFTDPAAVRGQEMLRQGENLWVYMPNLKRALRVASRDSFQGGDFNNADVLRVNYAVDYTAQKLGTSDVPGTVALELQARTSDAAYDKIRLWLREADWMPVKGEYYAASGKMLRSAEFSDIKSFAGFKRPAKIVMRNMLATSRFSEMLVRNVNVKVKPTASQFVLDNLGR
jgi:outer membrane lipoprotein-sorting protein